MDIESILFYLTLFLSVVLIFLVIFQPRQTQVYSVDTTTTIGRPSYWRTHRLMKASIFSVSTTLLVLLLIFMLLNK